MKYYKNVLLFLFLALIPVSVKAQIEVCKYPGCGKFIAKSKNEKGDRFCPYQGKHPVPPPAPMKVSKPVDLGLPSGTMWAEWNIGASSPEQKGYYYAWGETEPKEVYSWKTYFDAVDRQKLKQDDTPNFKEFLSDRKASIVGTNHDVAHVKWGKDWLIPTIKQWKELTNYCTVEWKTQKGVKGLLFTGPNGNSIFIPGCGFMHYRTLNDAGNLEYWTGDLCDDSWAWAFGANSDGAWSKGDIYNIYRRRGKQVRAVWNSAQAESLRNPGLLTIKTTPTDCEVQFDGTTVGRTPMNVSKVPFGKHVMYVFKDGYKMCRKEINIGKGERLQENLFLQQIKKNHGGIDMVKSRDYLYHLGDISEKEWSSVMGGNGNSYYSVSFKNRDELLIFIDHMEKETGLKAEVMFHKYGETIKQGDVIRVYLHISELPEVVARIGQNEQVENFYMDNPYCFESILEVDSEGNIDCPLLGRCHIAGLKENQSLEMLKAQYLSLFKQLGCDPEDDYTLIVSVKNRFLDRNAILQYTQDSMSKEYWASSFGIRLRGNSK